MPRTWAAPWRPLLWLWLPPPLYVYAVVAAVLPKNSPPPVRTGYEALVAPEGWSADQRGGIAAMLRPPPASLEKLSHPRSASFPSSCVLPVPVSFWGVTGYLYLPDWGPGFVLAPARRPRCNKLRSTGWSGVGQPSYFFFIRNLQYRVPMDTTSRSSSAFTVRLSNYRRP